MAIKFFKDRSGAAAVEFGFIAPILAGIVALGWNTWQGERAIEQAKTALRAGAEYYTAGGTSDAAVPPIITGAWASAPKNAASTAARTCYCDGVAISCTVPCTAGQTRTAWVTLTASGTGAGIFGDQTISQQETVRVQ
jgi:Flp pilus assembly protein TadG